MVADANALLNRVNLPESFKEVTPMSGGDSLNRFREAFAAGCAEAEKPRVAAQELAAATANTDAEVCQLIWRIQEQVVEDELRNLAEALGWTIGRTGEQELSKWESAVSGVYGRQTFRITVDIVPVKGGVLVTVSLLCSESHDPLMESGLRNESSRHDLAKFDDAVFRDWLASSLAVCAKMVGEAATPD
jgi:hypothetical protein